MMKQNKVDDITDILPVKKQVYSHGSPHPNFLFIIYCLNPSLPWHGSMTLSGAYTSSDAPRKTICL